jgi:hypothetical protein
MIAPLRRGHEGAGDPDTLAFTAGELVRAAVGLRPMPSWSRRSSAAVFLAPGATVRSM